MYYHKWKNRNSQQRDNLNANSEFWNTIFEVKIQWMDLAKWSHRRKGK